MFQTSLYNVNENDDVIRKNPLKTIKKIRSKLTNLFKTQRKELFTKDPSLKAANEKIIFEKYKSIFNDERLFLGNKNPIVGCFYPLEFEFDCTLVSKFHF